MKKIPVIILLLVGSCYGVRAQEKNSFQVLDCRNTFNERNKAVARFQGLNPDHEVHVGEKGYCLLVHASGEMIDLRGDTTVRVGDLKLSNDKRNE